MFCLAWAGRKWRGQNMWYRFWDAKIIENGWTWGFGEHFEQKHAVFGRAPGHGRQDWSWGHWGGGRLKSKDLKTWGKRRPICEAFDVDPLRFEWLDVKFKLIIKLINFHQLSIFNLPIFGPSCLELVYIDKMFRKLMASYQTSHLKWIEMARSI